jgi:hypothetical protein
VRYVPGAGLVALALALWILGSLVGARGWAVFAVTMALLGLGVDAVQRENAARERNERST